MFFAKHPDFPFNPDAFYCSPTFKNKPYTAHFFFEVKLRVTMTDIFDALTASDRPYRRAMPYDGAIKTLRSMADEGDLEPVHTNE